jgi:pimeloyl-ACP methyl ester carboxylesterase
MLGAKLVDTLWSSINAKNVINNVRSASASAQLQFYFADMGNTWVRYCKAGTHKPTIVIAVDPPGVIESYLELVQLLSQHFEVVVFEQPGFGFSLPKMQFKFDFHATTEFFVRFLRFLNVGPCVLSIPCVTGFSALAVANQFPDLVSKVVVIQQPNLRYMRQWAINRDSKGILRTPYVGQLALQMLKYGRIGDWFKNVIHDESKAEHFTHNTRKAFSNGACFCLATGFQDYLFSHIPKIAAIDQPALIVWGECDMSHGETDKMTSQELAVNYYHTFFSSAGHSPEIEAPVLFTKRLVDFVQGA